MNLVLPQINFIEVPRLMSVSYTATLPVRDQTVLYLSGTAEARSSSVTSMLQSVIVCGWGCDGTLGRDMGMTSCLEI
jgi:hypothetical protein